MIDPLKDMKIDDENLRKTIEKKNKLEETKKEYEKQLTPEELKEGLKNYENVLKYDKTISLLKSQIQDCNKMILQDDLKCMKRVLRRLDFIDKNEIVQLKGRVACDISACDEIMATELMFSGIFQEMEPGYIAALLSCMVYDERSNDTNIAIKNEKLLELYNTLLDHAKRIFKIYQDAKINIDEVEYMSGFNPKLMEITLAWCNGSSFLDICKMADIYEGSIIRCFRRLDELLRELAEASKSIGNLELETKFTQASKKLKRGIVFAGSLYI